MEFVNAFTVPVAPAEAWALLTDVPRIAPCLPGASVAEVDGRYEGGLSLKVGPIKVTYSGVATFDELDEEKRRMTLNARGREKSGKGTATAVVHVELLEGEDGLTRVEVLTELQLTGRLAQFGRTAMADVGERLIGQFAANLEQMLIGGGADAEIANRGLSARSDAARITPIVRTENAPLANDGHGPAADHPNVAPSARSANAALSAAPAGELDAIALVAPLLKRARPALLGLLVGVVLGAALRRPRHVSSEPWVHVCNPYLPPRA